MWVEINYTRPSSDGSLRLADGSCQFIRTTAQDEWTLVLTTQMNGLPYQTGECEELEGTGLGWRLTPLDGA